MKRWVAPIAAVSISLASGMTFSAQAELADDSDARARCEIGGLVPSEARNARPSRLQILWNPVEQAEVVRDRDVVAVKLRGAGGVLRGERAYALTEVELVANNQSDAYPAEARFIHENAIGDRVVVGVYLVEGESNPAFEKLSKAVDAEDGGALAGLHPRSLLPENDARLVLADRTPPACAPRVIWTVVDAPVEASREQLASLLPFTTLAARDDSAD
jgi:carbonic anhydrase